MADSTVVIPIQGMTCDHCVQAVKSALEGVAGVREVTISLPEKKATVHFDNSTCKSTELQAIIEAEGYAAGMYGSDSPAMGD